MAVFGAYVLKWSLKKSKPVLSQKSTTLCYATWKEDQVSPLVSLIKAYLEEKNIMKMGV